MSKDLQQTFKKSLELGVMILELLLLVFGYNTLLGVVFTYTLTFKRCSFM